MPTTPRAARAILAFALLLFPPIAAAQSQTPVQHSPDVSVSHAESSRPSPPVAPGTPPPVLREHPIGLNPFLQPPSVEPDPVLQTTVPTANMPATLQNFIGQGVTNSLSTITGDPPDPNGAVGPNHYVQAVNGGLMVWNKTGGVVQASQFINALWNGYTGTNAGNGCATQNDGDAVVVYDQLADRWFVTQFSLPNFSANTSPSFQCVAVSKTGDPTGAYWLYDFRYNVVVNDYGKFAIWPDAYYASFNNFGAATFTGADLCAYDRSAMLNGQPATQVCFQQSSSTFGVLPVSLEGTIKPPSGTPGFLLNLRSTTLGFYKFHVDWTTPANSTLTGPTSLAVASYSQACGGATCIVQPAPGNQLDSLGDRLMFRATYRNFGTHESIIVNHSVTAGTVTGVRWYEIRTPSTTPAIFQQGTYAPADAKYRWMGSIAQDQAQDMALGYSLSSSTFTPAVAWTGRTAGDAAGTMGQAEAIVHQGPGVETGTFTNGSPATRWGDYSNMTVDPSDDCTFWYTNEYYPANSIFHWDTQIASVKFDNCAQNDFSLSVTPASQSVAPGGQTTYTVSSALIKGAAETIALNIQDLPAGVTGAFNPTSITAGTGSTLTLTASAVAPLTASPVTFTVIGKATSAVHAATANVSVSAVAPPAAPTNVVATAASTTQVDVAWTLVAGATSYQVFRRAAGGAFTLVGSPATNAFSDTTVTAGNAYLYKVQAVSAGGNSADSNIDLATTVIFTDDPLAAGTTFVKGLHLTELRTAISAVATLAGTGPLTFTDPTITNTVPIKSVHVTELRSDLNTARGALALPALTFANSAASNTVVATTDFTELRNGVK